MQLTSFKKKSDDTFHLSFDDGTEIDLSARMLRDNCPCAGCKGESVLFYSYEPMKKNISPEGYQLKNAVPRGNYALQLFWNDGHDTGIYMWEYLKELSNK